MVRVSGLHPVTPGQIPFQPSGLDLFPVDPDSTQPHFVNNPNPHPNPPASWGS